jgi:S-adenosylmethionine-dependent methyltransferase
VHDDRDGTLTRRMAPSATARFDADPSAYAEYLRTPLGRLRCELAWRNLERELPRPRAIPSRALDLGAGTGELALRLAEAGWSVTLVDGSHRMLDQADQAARARGLSHRIACRTLDLDSRNDLSGLEASAYDLVLCHHVLEYVTSPEAILRTAREVLAPGGRVSLVVRNRTGEVLKRLLDGEDPDAALGLLATRRAREDLCGLELQLLDPGEVRALARAAGLRLIAERGVRVVADHLPGWSSAGEDAFDRMLRLELRLGETEEFLAIARYVQLIAAIAPAAE